MAFLLTSMRSVFVCRVMILLCRCRCKSLRSTADKDGIIRASTDDEGLVSDDSELAADACERSMVHTKRLRRVISRLSANGMREIAEQKEAHRTLLTELESNCYSCQGPGRGGKGGEVWITGTQCQPACGPLDEHALATVNTKQTNSYCHGLVDLLKWLKHNTVALASRAAKGTILVVQQSVGTQHMHIHTRKESKVKGT